MIRWPLTLALMWPLMAAGQAPPSTQDGFISPERRQRIEASIARAELQRQKGDLEAAERSLEDAYTLEPDYPRTVRRLAALMLERKNYPEAATLFRHLMKLKPTEAEAVFGLIDATAHPNATEEKNRAALRLASNMTRTGSAPQDAWRRVARIQGYLGLYEDAEETWSQVKRMGELDDKTRLDLCNFYRLRDEEDKAITCYTACAQGSPECSRRLLEITQSRTGARTRRAERARIRTAQLRPELARIDGLMERLQFRAAQTELLKLSQRNPLVPGVYSRLGECARKLGDRSRAELSFLQAVGLGSTAAIDYLKIAELYEDDGRTELAAYYFEQAHRAAPDNLNVQMRYTRSLIALQEYDLAFALTSGALSRAIPEPLKSEFSKLHQKVLERRKGLALVPSTTSVDYTSYQTAKRMRDGGDPDGALKILSRVPIERRSAQHWDLLGQLSEDGQDLKGALAHYRRAVERDGTRGDVLFRIASIHGASGRLDDWLKALQLAANQGSIDAELALFEHRMRPHEVLGELGDIFMISHLREISSRLSQAGSEARYGAVTHQTKITLMLRESQRRVQTVYGIGAGLCLVFAFLMVIGLRRRYGGISVESLIQHRPSAGPEVQRVLSAIRHEVLKHNTTALTGLVETLEQGHDVSESAAWLHESLFGGDDSNEQAASLRLDDYLDQLVRVGRSHGYRLNLKHGDPTFAALIAGFRSLDRLLRQLSKLPSGAAPSGRLVAELRGACEEVNGVGYRGVVAVLDMLKVTLVDAELLIDIFDGIRGEPSLRGHDVRPLQLQVQNEALPFQVAVTLHEFEDIIRNPLRNAIQATQSYLDSSEPIFIGLTVERQLEPITGLMSVALKIKDRCPIPLDPEILHSQDVERGLGLTLHLLIDHEGTISVAEEEAPWCKSVVIQLPLIEGDGEWAL